MRCLLTAASVLSALAASFSLSSSLGADTPDPGFSSGNAMFGFRILNCLAQAKPNRNVFISPTSLSMALSMTLNGASGQTRAAMTDALGFAGLGTDQINRENSALLESLGGPGVGVRLDIANSLWARRGVVFKEDFLVRNREFYRAEVRELELGPSAVAAINSWVKGKTQGKIPEIIKRMPARAILYLVNAVYFKGQWQDRFDKARTANLPFTLANGSKVAVPMMSRRGSYKYFAQPGLEAVSIPYGKGRISMYVLLPDKPSGLPDLCRKLSPETWEKWMRSFRTTELMLSLPRFKIEFGVEEELKTALQAMGMAIAFDPAKADFSKMCEVRGENVYISQIAHKTFVEVNEEGTEAAAATSVGVSITAAPAEPVKMIVDHPFLCVIRDNQTGAILFLGAILNPKQSA